MNQDSVEQLLRYSAYPLLDQAAKIRFKESATRIDDWGLLIKRAESHALSCLLYQHLQTCDVEIPNNHRISFKALTARHQRNNRERIQALVEILECFSGQNITTVILKGMALIHTLYDNTFQRPMGDIDILVERDQALVAQKLLRDIGYRAEERKQGYLYDHHHLPVATKNQNGISIQIEIHHNALSGDAPGSLSFEEVKDNMIEFQSSDQATHSLGHVQMLQHLCQHTFEPIENIKLGAIADIYGYASKYRDEIDWNKVKNEFPFVINTIRCLHFLSPMPITLSELLDEPLCSLPKGIGKGFPPLTSTFIKSRSLKDKLNRVFNCSDWWLHIFYVVPPEKSLFTAKYLLHPLMVFKWLSRRLLASLKHKFRRNK